MNPSISLQEALAVIQLILDGCSRIRASKGKVYDAQLEITFMQDTLLEIEQRLKPHQNLDWDILGRLNDLLGAILPPLVVDLAKLNKVLKRYEFHGCYHSVRFGFLNGGTVQKARGNISYHQIRLVMFMNTILTVSRQSRALHPNSRRTSATSPRNSLSTYATSASAPGTELRSDNRDFARPNTLKKSRNRDDRSKSSSKPQQKVETIPSMLGKITNFQSKTPSHYILALEMYLTDFIKLLAKIDPLLRSFVAELQPLSEIALTITEWHGRLDKRLLSTQCWKAITSLIQKEARLILQECKKLLENLKSPHRGLSPAFGSHPELLQPNNLEVYIDRFSDHFAISAMILSLLSATRGLHLWPATKRKEGLRDMFNRAVEVIEDQQRITGASLFAANG